MSLGLPDGIKACLFDLDGVLTQTAKVHAAAWKQMFDGYLRDRAEREGEAFVEFDARADYDSYVDGKPRADGVRSFLESRGISLPEGDRRRPAGAETVGGLGNRKNELVLKLIDEQGVEPYEGSVRYVKAAIDAGLERAVVSSSTNCRAVLRAGRDRRPVRGDRRRPRRRARGTGRQSPRPTPFSPGARALGVEARARRPSSRTRSPGSRRAARATSASSSASTASARRRRSPSTAPTSSSADLAELLER